MLDGNPAAVWRVEVYGRNGRCYVKGDPMFFRQHRNGVGADFVGDIAIGGDAICANDHGINFSQPHHCSGHVVGDERGRNAIFHQLPRCQT